jgi:hypothetical protein
VGELKHFGMGTISFADTVLTKIWFGGPVWLVMVCDPATLWFGLVNPGRFGFVVAVVVISLQFGLCFVTTTWFIVALLERDVEFYTLLQFAVFVEHSEI